MIDPKYTTRCGRDDVHFPTERRQQIEDLYVLSGDALMRGDDIAWSVLFEAALKLEKADARQDHV